MVYCCVPNCKSDASGNEQVSFHHFPSDPELKEKWIVAISRQGEKKGSLWSPSSTSRICNKHFKESDFSISTTRKRLLPNKIPSVFPGYPNHKQISNKRRNSPKPRSSPLPSKIRKTANDNNSCSYDTIAAPTKEVGVQVSVPNKQYVNTNNRRKYSMIRKSNERYKKTIHTLKKRLNDLKHAKKREFSKLHEKVNAIENNAENGDMKSIFLLEQIESYGKNNVKYGETTLKICVLWQRKSPSGYNYIRSMKCLKLPHKRTLKNYIGYTNGETGTTSLIKQRLHYEANILSTPEEKMGSLIIDEMAIKPKVIYDHNIDQFLGYSEGRLEEIGMSDRVANRLLCFLFRGLSTAVRIPVAFYFTRQLTGTQLHILTKKVIAEVEETGFQILRIVTDNNSVNVSMMKEMCAGPLLSQINHPNDELRPLFLSFDSSHILKNVRSQFLAKDFFHEGKVISSSHLKKLYDAQRNNLVKLVRGLTRKVLYPSNLEKMNVRRAKHIFSVPVTAALKTLPVVSPETCNDIEGLQKTVEFLDMIRTWHDIHDVCNVKQSYTSRNPDKRIFTQSDDERLVWLTERFLPFMEKVQSCALKYHKLSQETYEALLITTESTIKCIKYLLSVGYHYVLSRNLSSDDIELLFSHLRRKGGFNDMMDARSCMYAIESTLKTGMINPSVSSNVEHQTFRTLDAIRQNELKEVQTLSGIPQLPSEVFHLLDEPLEETPVTAELSSLAMIAGYLVRIAEENTKCESCLEQLSSYVSDSPLMHLIKMQDRGGLRYPSRKFVLLLKNILRFTTKSLQHVQHKNVLKKLKVFILPKFMTTFKCECLEHEKLSEIIVTKFLKPILQNKANEITDNIDDVKKVRTKPLSRKILKL